MRLLAMAREYIHCTVASAESSIQCHCCVQLPQGWWCGREEELYNSHRFINLIAARMFCGHEFMATYRT